jgi:hypothetical protein
VRHTLEHSLGLQLAVKKRKKRKKKK